MTFFLFKAPFVLLSGDGRSTGDLNIPQRVNGHTGSYFIFSK